MQLNKVLKELLLAVPIMAIAACSSHKSADDGQAGYGAGAGSEMSSEEQARLQMQELPNSPVVYFGFNNYDVAADYAQMLDAAAALLRSHPSYRLTVEGNTDERGTSEYNIALGERRAYVVKMYLQGKGVSADQISIVSYGKEKPAVLGHDEAAYAKNRRAELVILKN